MTHSNNEIHTNDKGGRSTKLRTQCTQLPPHALLEIAAVLKDGAEKYEDKNWHKLTVHENLDHGLEHIFNYLKNNELYELSHAATRLVMALDTLIREANNDNGISEETDMAGAEDGEFHTQGDSGGGRCFCGHCLECAEREYGKSRAKVTRNWHEKCNCAVCQAGRKKRPDNPPPEDS